MAASTGPEKAAVVLLSLGEDHGAIWRALDEEEIKEVSQAMAGLGQVTVQSILARDFLVVASCLLWEHTSLKAFWYVAQNWKRLIEKRRKVQSRQRVDDEYIASWFNYTPVSKPAPRRVATMSSHSSVSSLER